MRKALLISSLCLVPVLTAGANETKAPTPHESVQQRYNAIRRNNTRAFLGTLLSDEQIRNMGVQWDAMRTEKPSASESDQFRMTMKMLTEPGAEDTLMALLKPQLDEMRTQMPMLVGMFGGMVTAGIQEDENLSPEERGKATKVVQAVSSFLSENDLTDEASARKAVAVVCATARKLRVNSIEELQGLPFDQILGKADIMLVGLKDLFRIYGVDFDKWIDALEMETIAHEGDSATVRVHYEIFGIKDSVDEELVRKGQRWISIKAQEALGQ